MTPRLPAWALLALLSLALALGACRREPPAEEARAPGDPVAAVEAQAKALRDNDLVRYSRLSLPPELHARSEALWNTRVAEASPVDDREAQEYDRLMARLTAPDAEAALNRDLEPRLAQLESEISGQWPLMQATAGIFLNAAIQANTELTDEEKAHGSSVVAGLLAWAQPTLFTDRERARKAITSMVATARELDLPTLAQARALPMTPALEKGGVALAGFKDLARIYDLDIDRSLDGVKAELVSAEGDQARVRVSYPLLDQTITYEIAMVRRNGGWYGADAIRQAELELAEAGAGPAVELDDTGAAVEAPGADAGPR